MKDSGHSHNLAEQNCAHGEIGHPLGAIPMHHVMALRFLGNDGAAQVSADHMRQCHLDFVVRHGIHAEEDPIFLQDLPGARAIRPVPGHEEDVEVGVRVPCGSDFVPLAVDLSGITIPLLEDDLIEIRIDLNIQSARLLEANIRLKLIDLAKLNN